MPASCKHDAIVNFRPVLTLSRSRIKCFLSLILDIHVSALRSINVIVIVLVVWCSELLAVLMLIFDMSLQARA